MHQILFVLLTLQFSILDVRCNSPFIRQTLNGPVEGIKQTSIFGQKYYAFRGIPFAEAPITGPDPYTGVQVNRRFKVRQNGSGSVLIKPKLEFINVVYYFSHPKCLNENGTKRSRFTTSPTHACQQKCQSRIA